MLQEDQDLHVVQMKPILNNIGEVQDQIEGVKSDLVQVKELAEKEVKRITKEVEK
jgi:hypothetical protein